MIDTKSAFLETLLETYSAGKEYLKAMHANPKVIAAQPAIAILGVAFGAISGYEIGHTAVLKARGLWHPGLARPGALLTASLVSSIFCAPYMAVAIVVVTLASAIFGACRAYFEKSVSKELNFDTLQETFGAVPDGIDLISPHEFSKLANPTQRQVCGLIWHLTKTACDRGEGFTEGTFVLDGPHSEMIYSQLSALENSYSRHSSHFKGRTSKEQPQMGLDFASKDGVLPVGKRTILFGLAETHDHKRVLFIKPENWGADHRFQSFKNFEKIKHFIHHTLQFFHAQYVKAMRPGYDDRPGTAKERIPHNWVKAKGKFGWGELSKAQKKHLIKNNLAKPYWINDKYRTGREVYIEIAPRHIA